VAAESLDVVLRDEGPARPADALRVGALLAGSLDFATVVDINHGALHPRDVLVSQDEVRITGLGVTRALERVGVAAPVRRPYTAPERAAGAAWDRRADIFSLAALMHDMLWGRRISGTGPQAALTLTELAGGDLEALRRVFARALADDPDERFERALAFAEALHEAFPGMGTAAPRPERRRATPDTRRSFEEPSLPLDFGPPGGGFLRR
jgi:serine/threonine-protein kinase